MDIKKKIGISLGVVVVLGVLYVTIFWGNQTTTPPPAITQNSPAPVSTPVVTQTPPVDTPKKVSSLYANGTYSATGSYMSPGGEDQIGVTLTLANDIVTAVSVTPEPGDRTSSRYQNMFVNSYKQYVLGKNISSLYLTKISGSSLTPKGFDDALAQIKAQARA